MDTRLLVSAASQTRECQPLQVPRAAGSIARLPDPAGPRRFDDPVQIQINDAGATSGTVLLPVEQAAEVLEQ